MKRLTIISIVFIALVLSCDKPNEDIVKEPNKEGAIETQLSVVHNGNYDILITTHKIWVTNQLKKTIVTQDTLQSLAPTAHEKEDEYGNITIDSIPRDYEFYITVN